MSSFGVELGGVDVVADGRKLLDGVSLCIPAGESAALVGPSGAGKSTLLRALAGLVRPAAGTIALGGAVVSGPDAFVDPARRGVGFLFQGYALWPAMTAAEHLEFVLKAAKVAPEERRARIAETLGALGIAALAGRKPDALSGGERQRLALARALAARPRFLFLDEPTASLDPASSRDARALIADVVRRFGVTALTVTHDREEAAELGRLTAVLHCGRLRQIGTPEDLYASPADAFTALFCGDGVLLPAEVDAEGRRARTPLGELAVRGARPGRRGAAVLRPEDVVVADAGGTDATVRAIAFRSGEYRARLSCGETTVEARLTRYHPPGAALRIAVAGPLAVVPAEE
jgi:iron(III) transport system ATP-binding protein